MKEKVEMTSTSRAWALVSVKSLLKETYGRRHSVYHAIRPMVRDQVRDLVATARDLQDYKLIP